MKQGTLFSKYFAALLLIQEDRYTLLLGVFGEGRKTRNTIVIWRWKQGGALLSLSLSLSSSSEEMKMIDPLLMVAAAAPATQILISLAQN